MVDEYVNGFVSRFEVRDELRKKLAARAHSAGLIDERTWGQSKSNEASIAAARAM